MNILLVLNLLIFWSIRSMWSGIIAIAGKPAPYILFIILVTTTFLITILNMYKKPLFPAVIFACFINILFLGLSGYILSVTLDSLHYFVLEFFRSTAFLGGIALFIYLCFYSFRVNWLQKKWIQPVCILVLTIIGFLISFDIQLFNGFDKKPKISETPRFNYCFDYIFPKLQKHFTEQIMIDNVLKMLKCENS